jgi:CheY-like chemotaxis protein
MASSLQEDLERELQTVRAERDELVLRLAAVPRATNHAALHLAEADKALLSIRQARDSVLARCMDLTKQLAAANERIAELADTTELAERARDAALDQLRTVQQECADLRVQLREVPQPDSARTNPPSTHEIAELATRLAAERAQLQREFEQWKTAAQVQIAALRAQLADRSKQSVAAADDQRQRLEIAELRAELDSLREELRRERISGFDSIKEPVATDVPVPVGLQTAESAAIPEVESHLNAIRQSLMIVAADPSQLETLDVLASQFQDVAQRALSAGCLGAHRLSTLCAEVTAWLRKSPGKIPATLPAMDRACELLGKLVDPQTAARVGDPAGALVHAVDDDVDNCECIAMALEKISLRTRYSIKPETALAELTKTPCDLLILDIDLGGGQMDGFELHEQICKIDHFHGKPVLYVSGLPGARERIIEIHGTENDLITKPYNLNALTLKVLSSLLNARLGAN